MEQLLVFGTLAVILVLMVTGPLRYDIIALTGLLFLTITGIIPANETFLAFGHPAVVIVAAIFIVTRALERSGLIEQLSHLYSGNKSPSMTIACLCLLVAGCSSFMSSVGALAIFIPVSIKLATKQGLPPSAFLMPIAFASLLGAMTTLIGSSANIIVSEFRFRETAAAFQMFDFTPVGGITALAGILFVAIIGWRLLPTRSADSASGDLFQIRDYVFELRVMADSPIVGNKLNSIVQFSQRNLVVAGIIRDGQRTLIPKGDFAILADDVLVVEGGSESLSKVTEKLKLEVVGSEHQSEELLRSDNIRLAEAVVLPNSFIEGNTIISLRLRNNYSVNLLAVSRNGERLTERLGETVLRGGDVLLLQGTKSTIRNVFESLGCLPLAERNIATSGGKMLSVTAIFLAAVLLTSFGILPVQIAFVACALAMVIFRFVSLEDAYNSISWPIIMLLGAMIPIGHALETTGGAQSIADQILILCSTTPPLVTLVLVLIITMILSDIVNNAATAIIMCPIALELAQSLHLNPDALLMAVAIGSSCAFLTPIGHQSNTLVLGPGGYKFGDYARMGLPLQLLIIVVATFCLATFWL